MKVYFIVQVEQIQESNFSFVVLISSQCLHLIL